MNIKSIRQQNNERPRILLFHQPGLLEEAAIDLTFYPAIIWYIRPVNLHFYHA